MRSGDAAAAAVRRRPPRVRRWTAVPRPRTRRGEPGGAWRHDGRRAAPRCATAASSWSPRCGPRCPGSTRSAARPRPTTWAGPTPTGSRARARAARRCARPWPCSRPGPRAPRPSGGLPGRGRGRAGAQLLPAARRPHGRRRRAAAPPHGLGALGRRDGDPGRRRDAGARPARCCWRPGGRTRRPPRRLLADAHPRAGPRPGRRTWPSSAGTTVGVDGVPAHGGRQDRRRCWPPARRSARCWPAAPPPLVAALRDVRRPARRWRSSSSTTCSGSGAIPR